MAVNKVQYGNNTLIDLTSDTVTAEKLLQGETAHNAAGEEITGTMSGGGSSGVSSFNGRSGSVLPMAGDYDATQVNYDTNNTVKQKIDSISPNNYTVKIPVNPSTTPTENGAIWITT